MQAIANQGMTHGGNVGSKHPGTLLNGISEEGQDTSAFQSESLFWACSSCLALQLPSLGLKTGQRCWYR